MMTFKSICPSRTLLAKPQHNIIKGGSRSNVSLENTICEFYHPLINFNPRICFIFKFVIVVIIFSVKANNNLFTRAFIRILQNANSCAKAHRNSKRN